MELVNPHSWIWIDVKGKDGTVVNWGIEGGPPSNLFRNGITRASLPVGTRSKLFGYQAKSGESKGVGVFVEYLDGQEGVHGRVRAGRQRSRGCRRETVEHATPSAMSLLRFFEWLATTRGSIALHQSLYVYLIVSTVHVVTLSVFVGTAAMLDLRLLGATMRRVPVSEVAARLRPWTMAGFLLMVVSGALLFYANPPPRYQDIFFRAKMVMLVLAAINAWVFHSTVCRNMADMGLRSGAAATGQNGGRHWPSCCGRS